MVERISARGRNRALLARQLLLARADIGCRGGARAPRRDAGAVAAGAVRRAVVAARAASTRTSCPGCWSTGRSCAATTLRTTVHLSTTRDYLVLRPAVQVVLDRSFASSPFAKELDGVDVDRSGLLDATCCRGCRSPGRLSARFSPSSSPGCDPESLGYAATWSEPVVQVPPRGVWHASRPGGLHAGRDLAGCASSAAPAAPEDLLLRYLGAFGPATVADAQVWSGLTGLRAAADRLRPRLVVLVDDDGRELLDLPDAPRPDDDVPAPVRFVPEYDNLLLSHADRSHVIADDHRPRVFVRGAVLVDGYVAGAWKLVRRRGTTTLALETFRSLRRAETADVDREAHALLGFVAPGGEHCLETVAG